MRVGGLRAARGAAQAGLSPRLFTSHRESTDACNRNPADGSCGGPPDLTGRLRHAIALVVALVAAFAVIITRSLSLSGAAQATVGFASASAFVVVFSQLMRREREARAEVERLHDRLADYVTQVEELATTKERNRIAREVHDGLGHTLTVASVQLQAERVTSTGRKRTPRRSPSFTSVAGW